MSAQNGHYTAGRVSGRKRARGYIEDYKPHAKTRALLEQVQEILDEYEDHLPLTVRQIFYRLVGAYGYEKTERAYGRLVDHLGNARRGRMIPFGVIRDDGVTGTTDVKYANIEAFHDETAKRARGYRRDRQALQPAYLELFCEAAGMVRQLERVAHPYSVSVWSGSGFDSLTAKYQVALRALERERPTILLHVGDYDPSGESIFASMTEDAAAFVEADHVIQTLQIEAVRVALTAEQVAEYKLPTAPPKQEDSRSRYWTGETCQLEALAPDVLAEIVKQAIVDRLDFDILSLRLDVERMERAELLGLPSGEA
jgi:hypothetical protein